MILKNVNMIMERIEDVKNRYGISEDITVLAATKTRTVDEVKEVIKAGITYIGENRVQEARNKYPFVIGDNLHKHMIGHLQKNKVKYCVELFDTIQSVESFELIEEIEKRMAKADKIMDIMFEVNISNEASKFGIKPDEIDKFLEFLQDKEHIRVKGLMTMLPFSDDEKLLRKYASDMRKVFDDKKRYNDGERIIFEHLSMGMSNDFELTIAEGSNMVRLGTIIFGERGR